MPEKKTSNMLVRDIPIDVWERIDKLCRRKNMKRRDFVEKALYFFEEEDGVSRKQNVSIQPPDIEGLKSDLGDPDQGIEKDDETQNTEFNIDPPDRKNRVGIDQLKPVSDSKLIKKHLVTSDPVSPEQEKKNNPLTTVYCWELDVQSDR